MYASSRHCTHPPLRDFGVGLHQLAVDVGVLELEGFLLGKLPDAAEPVLEVTEETLKAHLHLAVVVEEGVGEGCNRC